MLDILFKSNIDVSGLNILRKFAEDWTREWAEAKLDPNSPIDIGGYDPGSVYTLGTFFTNPMSGGTPAYQLYPDLGLAAAKRLLKLREESPNGSALYTILKYKINEKVPEVAQDIVNILINSGDTFNYFGHNFHKTNPEALEPLMLSLLKATPSNYFYLKKRSKGKTDAESEMVNEISFPEEERAIIGDIIDGLEGKEPKYGSTAYNILMEHDGWRSNPEAARPFMQSSIDWVGSGGGGAGKYIEAYPEETINALRGWAKKDPKRFVESRTVAYDAEAFNIAISALAKEDPASYFHAMYFKGKDRPEVFYNESINHRENIANAIDSQMNKDPSEAGAHGSGSEYFLTSDVWSDAMEAVGIQQEVSGKSIRDYAMNKLLEEAGSLRAAFADPDYDPDPDKSGRFKDIVEKLFGIRAAYGIDVTGRFEEYIDHPMVKQLAEFYARNNIKQFFESSSRLHDHFPEVARNNLLKYIEFKPLEYFTKDFHTKFPEFIEVALSKYKSQASSHLESGVVIRMKRAERLFDYFKWHLDDLDSEGEKSAMAIMAFLEDLGRSTEEGIAAKYPKALLAFLNKQKRVDLEKADKPDSFFRNNLPSILRGASDDGDENKVDEIISSFAYSLAEKDPLFFFTRQLSGESNSYYHIMINEQFSEGLQDEELKAKIEEKEHEHDKNLLIANLYPEFIETALEALLKSGKIYSFYNVIKNYNVELSLEDEEYLLKRFIYGKNAGIDSNYLETSAGSPPLSAAKLFKYMKDSNDYSLKDKFPEFIKKVAENFALIDSANFDKYEVSKLYPDIKYKNISSLRQIENKEEALNHFNGAASSLVRGDLPNHIKINRSMYQDDQRPDEWEGHERFTISQNNTNPTDLLYNINKKLIHAGDGVQHTNVGASGFTSAWALATVHGSISKHEGDISTTDHSSNLKILEAVEDLKQYFWQLSKDDKNEEILNILKEKGVKDYLADEAATDTFHRLLQAPIVGSMENPMGYEPVEAGLADNDISYIVKMIDREIGVPDYKIGGLIYIVLKNFDVIKAWKVANQPEWLVKILADIFRPIINLQKKTKEGEEGPEDFPEETLVIEQYQSDYPVVYDRIFLGNLRDDDGGVTGKEYTQLNNMILQHLDVDAAKAWLEKSNFSEQWNDHISNYREVHGDEHFRTGGEELEKTIINVFFKEHVINDFDPEEHFPLEASPQAKDARKHFDIISKVYPYLVIINTIEVAKKLDHKYIYILKNAPFYASIQNVEKATKLYKNIPELVATSRSIDKDLYVSNKIGTAGYDEKHLETVYEVPANDESIAVLRSAAQKLSGQNDQYDFSLTPAQNKTNIAPVKKDSTWNPTPEKIEKLKELSGVVQAELSGIDVPDFYDPVSIMRYLNSEIKTKIVPKKRFNSTFGPIMRELGKLSRASRLLLLMNEMIVKTSSHNFDRKRELRKLSFLRIINFIRE